MRSASSIFWVTGLASGLSLACGSEAEGPVAPSGSASGAASVTVSTAVGTGGGVGATGVGGSAAGAGGSTVAAGGSGVGGRGSGGSAGGMGGGGSGGSAGSGGSSPVDGGGAIDASLPPRGDGGCQFGDVVSAAQFQMLFPDVKPPYSYDGLVAAAVRYYPAFTCSGDLATRKREAAAFLANVVHETIGFQYGEEIACANGQCATSAACQGYIGGRDARCAGKCYDGRGAIQLSYCNNYVAASAALGLGSTLVDMPEVVATDPEIAIATAVWFWMAQGKCHDAILNGSGFGATVRAINGIECTSSDPVRIGQWQDRLEWFTKITAALGIPVGDTSGCR